MRKLIGAYQGIDGSHSKEVLSSYFKQCGLDFSVTGNGTFRQVAMSVLSGKADVGILPVDNAIAGTVREGYDLLAQYDLVPIVEIEWRMDHRLLAKKGAELSGIREIHAHPLVLEECGSFLGSFVGARVIPSEDTGAAAKEVADSSDVSRAAIAPPQAAEIYGLESLAENIADHPENFTRFLVFRAPNCDSKAALSLGGKCAPSERKTSLLLGTSHESGALASCLGILSRAGINLSKLESRPKLGKAWEYLFYVDFEGDIREARVAAAIEELRKHTAILQVIGSYDRHGGKASADAAEASLPLVDLKSAQDGWSEDLLPSSAKGWPRVARSAKPQGSRITVGGVTIGGGEFVVMAGPCSVESREQVFSAARAIQQYGGAILRGGAFKPRTNPYAFQGMGWEGVSLLAEAGRASGMPVISEVMSIDQVERMSREVDILQIGARNMQNFDLLRAVGRTDRPVMMKRGLSASIDELLAASEYILDEGNPNVILCERGIRTFETATRNTLDLSAVPVLRERTHLPIVVDPSHGVGVKRWIRPLCRAAKAVGAHGIIIEVHPNPCEAKSDKEQALTFEDFRVIMSDLAAMPEYL